MLTWICSIDSSEIGATLVRSPGCAPRPKELLKYDPSTVMLFRRLSWPANELPLAWGVRRVTSPIRPVMVGRFWISSRLTCVAAPVLLEANTVSATPDTVTSSVTVIGCTFTSTSVDTPRFTITFSLVCGCEGRIARPGEDDLNRIRAAHAHVGNRISAVGPRRRFVAGAGRFVDSDDGRAADGLLLCVDDHPADGSRRDALCIGVAHGARQRAERDHREREAKSRNSAA